MFTTIHIGASVRQKHSRSRRSSSTICGWHTFSVAFDLSVRMGDCSFIPCTHFGIEHILRLGSFSRLPQNRRRIRRRRRRLLLPLLLWHLESSGMFAIHNFRNVKCYINIDVNRMCASRLRFSSPRVRTTFQDYYWFRKGHEHESESGRFWRWLLTMRFGEYLVCASHLSFDPSSSFSLTLLRRVSDRIVRFV